MNKLQNYVTGQWLEGNGEGVPMFDAVTGEIVALSDTSGLDFANILQYGREKGDTLRKMTFQERGNMLKKASIVSYKEERSILRVKLSNWSNKSR